MTATRRITVTALAAVVAALGGYAVSQASLPGSAASGGGPAGMTGGAPPGTGGPGGAMSAPPGF